MSKRGRACEACSKIKIKCELGASTGLEPPCERCLRLKKQCVLSQPKRQKDRVAELEAQVETLTRLLQAQGIRDPAVISSTPASEALNLAASDKAKKKRRRVDDASSYSASNDSPTGSSSETSQGQDLNVAILDQTVDYATQEQLLNRYLNKQLPVFPLVPINGDCSLDVLRNERPVLMYAVIYAAGPGILSEDQQESVSKILLNNLTNVPFSPGPQTLDIIQAIQITCLYYRSPRHYVQLSVFGLIEVGLKMVTKLGHAGPLSPPPTVPVSVQNTDVGSIGSIDAWRAILVSHLLATAMSIFIRRKPHTRWTKEHDMCLLQLQYSVVSKPTDAWLSQLIRAEHVCEQIAEQMGFWDSTTFMDLADPSTRLKTQTCRNIILNWRMTIPSHIRTPLLLFWEHLATAYMHEAVLHTATNKHSFAAPFVAENLSVSDFPAPAIVTQDQITALFELTTAAQAMIDLFSSLDVEILAVMSGYLHSSRAAYALFILAKLSVATMAPGNTFGAVLDGNMLLVGHYADKLIDNGTRVRAIDERCAPARILLAADSVKEWYLNFTSIVSSSDQAFHQLQEPENLQAATGSINMAQGPEMSTLEDGLDLDAAQLTAAAVDWENHFYYSLNTADFGLDMLFAEEPQPFGGEVYHDAAYQARP
ncbi:uncharacterized protein RCC_03023 [Ramularia collo-cygni]|uniref:Zn(2)-C6 fungal-type domain-containing protein n=1 Tax=Ramularia collo-cygni TaxID=112498 RepID=A0A2D3UPD9_9PEZI|nr:uncharacterized protein RCC_03023 [Ramularia collo-cygni]CZT17191.1 uncharacterized protein RCC_03023 [Ramularia collo-cygni]